MIKAELLKRIQAERQQWGTILAKMSEADMLRSRGEDGWTVKDMIAHISWFEREMVTLIEARALVGSELWLLPPDERNKVIYEQNLKRPLASILTESTQIHQQLLDALSTLPDTISLDSPADFENMPPDWIPWQIIASNSYKHYQAHLPDLAACQRDQKQEE